MLIRKHIRHSEKPLVYFQGVQKETSKIKYDREQSSPHLETSQICLTNQLTGFYIRVLLTQIG